MRLYNKIAAILPRADSNSPPLEGWQAAKPTDGVVSQLTVDSNSCQYIVTTPSAPA